MSEALTLLLHALRTEQKPTDDADLVDRLHWSGELALQQVLSACRGATDPLSFGLRNFAYTFKVADGLGSDEHQAVIRPALMALNSLGRLGYEGVVGLASHKGML